MSYIYDRGFKSGRKNVIDAWYDGVGPIIMVIVLKAVENCDPCLDVTVSDGVGCIIMIEILKSSWKCDGYLDYDQ